MTTTAELLVTALADHGVTQVWGVVGDALNPVTDAIRRDERVEWVGVRHEEVAAFAAGAQAQLSGRLGVCMGTVGPGAIHLLNGLYDAKKSKAPVLAICGQVPTEEIGSDFFQEVDNDVLFADVAVYNTTLTSPDQVAGAVEQAVNTALAEKGVAVLTIPGDVGNLELPDGTDIPRFLPPTPLAAPSHESGLPEFGTVLHNPDLARVAEAIGLTGFRVEDTQDVDSAVRDALATPGPVLLDVITNADEVAIPPKPTLAQGWGFAIAKSKEFIDSPE